MGFSIVQNKVQTSDSSAIRLPRLRFVVVKYFDKLNDAMVYDARSPMMFYAQRDLHASCPLVHDSLFCATQSSISVTHQIFWHMSRSPEPIVPWSTAS